MALPASALAVRMRLKWLLAVAAVITAGASACLVTLRPVGLLMIVASLSGAAFIIHHIVSAPFFMRNSSPKERLHLFGVNYAVEILASVAGVAGGGWMAQHLGAALGSEMLGLRITLLTASGILSLSIIPYVLIHSPSPPKRPPGHRLWRVRRPALLAKLLVPTFLLGCGAGLVIPFLNLYFRDRFDLEPGAIGRVFAVSQGLTAAGFILGPVLARRFGMVRAVVTAELCSIPFFITLAFTQQLGVAIVAFWIRGALMNMNHPISSNFSMEVVEPDEHAFTNASRELSWSLSWTLSTLAGGWLIEGFGFALPMMITVCLYLTSSLLFLSFFHDYERKHLTPRARDESWRDLPDEPVPR
jgi:predicted MFS family arabinose efflux permease